MLTGGPRTSSTHQFLHACPAAAPPHARLPLQATPMPADGAARPPARQAGAQASTHLHRRVAVLVCRLDLGHNVAALQGNDGSGQRGAVLVELQNRRAGTGERGSGAGVRRRDDQALAG